MPIAPPTPAERLTELSFRLSRGADACDNGWWLTAPLMALIATWLRDMAETLARLAELLQQGKLPLHPSAPRQGASRQAGTRTKRHTRSPRPVATAQARSPLPDPEMAEPPAIAPSPARRPPFIPSRAERPAAPAPRRRPVAVACGPPIPFTAWNKHLPWHAHNVTIS